MYGNDEFGSTYPYEWSAQEEASAQAGAEVAGSSDAPATARAASIVRLPPVGSVGTWLAALVDRDGQEDVVRALLQAVPAQRLMDIVEELCTREFGVHEPTICYDSGQEGTWEAAPSTGATSPVTVLLTKKRARTASGGDAPYHPKRCWHCEPYMGRQDTVCTAKQTLGTLEEVFEEQAQLVEDEEEFGDPHGDARRAARYFLYRKWVYAAFGFLGKGKRIRIPPCVVEHIRSRFREPGCECALGGPLYNCRDYTGHRSAPGGEQDEE